MTGIVTWNVQCGLGVDGKIDLDRIATVVDAMGEADVICLQEVARHMPELTGGEDIDQVAELQARFPAHEAVFGPALDRQGQHPGRRAMFGNLVLSRLPVVQAFRHPLPQPADPTVKHMPRQAVEAIVDTDGGPLRVMTTHLEFHSEGQRMAQVRHLRDVHRDVLANLGQPPQEVRSGPYHAPPRPGRSVICGDFNTTPGDAVYTLMTRPIGSDVAGFEDAWRVDRDTAQHPPTCGIFDHRQWPQGPHCRDFFFVTPDLTDRIAALNVNMETDASDHQPLYLELRDR